MSFRSVALVAASMLFCTFATPPAFAQATAEPGGTARLIIKLRPTAGTQANSQRQVLSRTDRVRSLATRSDLPLRGSRDLGNGLVVDALTIARAPAIDLWVVEAGTRGPFAEASRIPGDSREAIARLHGVVAAGSVTYQTIEAEHRGGKLRLYVVGYEPDRPGAPARLSAGRRIAQSHYEMIADRRTGFELGDRIRLGRQIVFDVTSKIPGRLILIDEAAATRSMVAELTERIFDGDVTALMTHLISAKQFSRNDLAKVKALIARHESAKEPTR